MLSQWVFLKRYICNVVVICVFRTMQVRSLILQTIPLPWICFIPAFCCVLTPEKSFLQFMAHTVLKMIPGVPSRWHITGFSQCDAKAQRTFLNTWHCPGRKYAEPFEGISVHMLACPTLGSNKYLYLWKANNDLPCQCSCIASKQSYF